MNHGLVVRPVLINREWNEGPILELKHGDTTRYPGMCGGNERRAAHLFLFRDNKVGAALEVSGID